MTAPEEYFKGIDFDKPWEEPTNHTLHFQTYGRGSGVGHIDLLIDPVTKTLAGYELPSYRGVLMTLFEDEWWPEDVMATMVEARVAEAEQGMDRVIGQTNVDLNRGGEGETRMGNHVCDAMREEVTADFAFTNLGGIRDEIPAGTVTPRQVFRVLPFGNSLMVFEMDGRLLKEVIEYRVSAGHHGVYMAGGKIIYNKTRPDYDRVTYFEIGNEWNNHFAASTYVEEIFEPTYAAIKKAHPQARIMLGNVAGFDRDALLACLGHQGEVGDLVGKFLQMP